MTTLYTTDYKWKPFKSRWEVPTSVLKSEFDWLDPDADYGFFRYQGTWYHLSMFESTAAERHGGFKKRSPWDGTHSNSAWTGVKVAISPDGEEYLVAAYRSVSSDDRKKRRLAREQYGRVAKAVGRKSAER